MPRIIRSAPPRGRAHRSRQRWGKLLSNTVIGKNTFLDNQIHIAHNVKIGENSIIAGQVGIAGSSILGNNVRIGGQAGISGHLTIGNNVEIAGGSGVIKNISDNSKVMGYPAKNIRDFLKDNKCFLNLCHLLEHSLQVIFQNPVPLSPLYFQQISYQACPSFFALIHAI